MTEVWYESEAALTQFTASPQYSKFRADELNFVDVSRAENLTAFDHVMLDGERVRGMVKGMFMIKRKPGLTVADFRQHWLEVHAPIALKEMNLRRYVQCHTIDSVYNFCEPPWDVLSLPCLARLDQIRCRIKERHNDRLWRDRFIRCRARRIKGHSA